jgi:serine/threonine protein kinase
VTPQRWREIEELYTSASARPREERDSFLKEACPDPELRGEVLSLLANGDTPSAFVDRPAWEAQELSLLSPGSALGPYEIVRRIATGGMGEVYEARDTRLLRAVAIKTGREKFSARFEREARAIGALNHPHICQIYDVGPNYLVMEYIAGQPVKGPLALDRALQYAIEICDALSAAHSVGIVHRDLKPANVLLTKSGVKVLDFGLAKRESRAVDSAGEQFDAGITQQGTISGTLHYMAPEQLQGKGTDARADIFSFGCLFYEMLTGKPAFDGQNPASVIAAILERPSPPLSIASATPALERVLQKCLAKDRDKRWQSASDLGDELAWIAKSAPDVPSRRRPKVWYALAALSLVGIGAVFGFLRTNQPAPSAGLALFKIDPPPGTEFGRDNTIAVSPDGAFVVFGVATAGTSSLWLRSVDSLSARRLPGTENGIFPFWSPDSKSLAFFAANKLMRLDLAGDVLVTLCAFDATNNSVAYIGSGAWSRRGDIVFNDGNGLVRIPASGGTQERLTRLGTSPRETSHKFPQFLPDSKRFLYFIVSPDPGIQGIYCGALDQPGKRTRILSAASKAVYVPPRNSNPGMLLWVASQTLVAQPFDPSSLRLTGNRTPVVPMLRRAPAVPEFAAFWVSDAGLLVYRAGENNARLVWRGRDGRRLGTVGPEANYNQVALSREGERIAVARSSASDPNDIWLLEPGRAQSTRVTFDPASDMNPVWSPDGRQVAFSSNRTGTMQLYKKDSARRDDEQLTDTLSYKWAVDWRRDGRYILYVDQTSLMNLWALPLQGDRRPVAVVQTPFRVPMGKFSPDGNWVAFVSDQSGEGQVYVQAFPSGEHRHPVSNTGGGWPVWSGDGKELFYRRFADTNDTIMAVSIKVGSDGIDPGPPKELFSARFSCRATFCYDVTADGHRFLISEPTEPKAELNPLTVALNWQGRLKP